MFNPDPASWHWIFFNPGFRGQKAWIPDPYPQHCVYTISVSSLIKYLHTVPRYLVISVRDLEPDPQDPLVFGPSGSGLFSKSHRRKESDPDPDSLLRTTDPRIRIRTKMSRISNTAGNCS
jgi:hypothetical protein